MLRFLTWRNTAVGDVEVLVDATTRIREDKVWGLHRACCFSFTSLRVRKKGLHVFLTKHHSHSRKVLVGLRKRTGWIQSNPFKQQNLCLFNVMYWPIPYYGECCGSVAVGIAELICRSSRRAGSFICPAVISFVDVDYVWTWVGRTDVIFWQAGKRLQLMYRQQGCFTGTGLQSTASVSEMHRSEL